jgi:hypothetical protein
MRATRVISLSITLAAASLLANAQTFNEVQVNLPYTITAGSAVLPAGNYEIRPLADQVNTFGLYKDGVICKAIVQATPMNKVNSNVETSVVLNVDGDHYQLSQLWVGSEADGATGYQFVIPRVAKALHAGATPLVVKARRG